MTSLKDKCAIVGVGNTKYVRGSGVSTLSLAIECSKKAMDDAGLGPKDIDGLLTFCLGEPLSMSDLAQSLAIPQVNFQFDITGGGNNGSGVVITAAAAIEAGLATNIMCVHAINRFSGVRYGAGGFNNFAAPFGKVQAGQAAALYAQRHMHDYGTTAEQFGAIPLTFRKHAIPNENALMRTPLSMEEYLKSRIVSTPLRLYDCCLETDGGVAVIVSSAEQAKTMRKKPIYIMAGAANTQGPGLDMGGDTPELYTTYGAKYVAPRLFGTAGITPKDIDFAQIYDAFTIYVLCQLEGYGFCKKGESGSFVEGGKRITYGGELPLNTSGGHLSEGYVRGMNLIAEAVRQLRGECGPRQLKDVEIGLTTSAPNPGGALILRR